MAGYKPIIIWSLLDHYLSKGHQSGQMQPLIGPFWGPSEQLGLKTFNGSLIKFINKFKVKTNKLLQGLRSTLQLKIVYKYGLTLMISK